MEAVKNQSGTDNLRQSQAQELDKLKALVKLDDLKKSKDRSNDYPFSDEEKK